MTAIWLAIVDMPRRIHGALADPIRRRNLAARVVEGYTGGLAVLLLAGQRADEPWTWAYAAAAPLAELLIYEFVLEPLGWSGHYFERGPRDGETFRYW